VINVMTAELPQKRETNDDYRQIRTESRQEGEPCATAAPSCVAEAHAEPEERPKSKSAVQPQQRRCGPAWKQNGQDPRIAQAAKRHNAE
jgi:hypothetical protein